MFHFTSPFEVWVLIPMLIFIARIMDVSINTVRIMFVARGYLHLAPLLGFFEVLIWLLAMSQIMQNLDNPVNYIAYALGFATGNFVGMFLEQKIAMGLCLLRIITRKDANELINHLRTEGYYVVAIDAQGNLGQVKVIFTIVKRRKIPEIVLTIQQFNPQAVYTVEDMGFVSKNMLPVHPSIPANRK